MDLNGFAVSNSASLPSRSLTTTDTPFYCFINLKLADAMYSIRISLQMWPIECVNRKWNVMSFIETNEFTTALHKAESRQYI